MKLVHILKGLISSDSSPIWVLVNSNHLMLGLEYARQFNVKVNYADIGDQEFDYWNQSLGISIKRYCSSLLILPIFGSLLSRILGRGNKSVLYTPHLHGSMFSEDQLFIIHLLSKLDLISYYDDGMALVSRSGTLWKKKFIPCKQSHLIGWNYAFREISFPKLTLSINLAYTTFLKSVTLNSSYQSNNYEQINNYYAGRKKLIIASKWLDWVGLDKLNPLSHPAEYCYVKHYRASKNNPLYEQTLVNWIATPNLELVLPSHISSFSHCYFGVTSTILFILDVLLDSDFTVDTLFVPLISQSTCNNPEEAADFIQALRAYSTRLNIYIPN